MKHSKRLLVADKAMELVVEVIGLRDLNDEVLRDLLVRAAVDVNVGISLAMQTDSSSAFAAEIDRAVGASYRLECQLLIAREVQLIEAKAFASLEARTQEIQKMLVALRSSAKRGFAGSGRRQPKLAQV